MSYVKTRYLVIKYSIAGFNSDDDASWKEAQSLETAMLTSIRATRRHDDVLLYELVDDPETDKVDGRVIFNLTVELAITPEGPLFDQVKEELLERLKITFRDKLRIECIELQAEVVSVETVEVKL